MKLITVLSLIVCMTNAYSIDTIHLKSTLPESSLAKPRYFTQKQDNFDGSNANTWQQTYYVNDTYWNGDDNAPVFICCGGEGPPLDGSVVQASPHCNDAVEWLKDTGAILFAVEHRYYTCHNKDACPIDVDGPEPLREKLKYLSSRQALADLANFVGFAKEKYNISENSKWVSFGGSYPGMLAGWFRIKFPHLIHAAVSSSSPVNAKLDMVGYNDVVAEAYAEVDVGGSVECSKAIFDGHQNIGKLLQTKEGRKLAIDLFELKYSATELQSVNVQREFCGNGVAQFPAQSNDPACVENACNIAKICSIMVDTSIGDEVHRLAKVRKLQGGNSFQLIPSTVKVLGRDLQAMSFMDALWFWQTCTEFGFYQTCEVGSKCFYTQGLVTLESMVQPCKEAFDIDTELVATNIRDTNLYFGANKPEGSRVLFLSGTVDPWKALSITTSPDENDFPVIIVPGSSHHRWTYPSAEISQVSVFQARQKIYDTLNKWLQEE